MAALFHACRSARAAAMPGRARSSAAAASLASRRDGLRARRRRQQRRALLFLGAQPGAAIGEERDLVLLLPQRAPGLAGLATARVLVEPREIRRAHRERRLGLFVRDRGLRLRVAALGELPEPRRPRREPPGLGVERLELRRRRRPGLLDRRDLVRREDHHPLLLLLGVAQLDLVLAPELRRALADPLVDVGARQPLEDGRALLIRGLEERRELALREEHAALEVLHREALEDLGEARLDVLGLGAADEDPLRPIVLVDREAALRILELAARLLRARWHDHSAR